MAKDLLFTTIRSEGGLLPTDLLARVREPGSGLPGTAPVAYHLAPGEKLNEAITRSWNRLTGAWRAFEGDRAKAGPGNVLTGATRQQWLLPLFQELGFGQLQTTTKVSVGEKDYPVSHRWEHVPIHLIGAGLRLDQRTAGAAGAAAMSPHGMVQELLNRSDDHLWGMVSNGLSLQLLRDNASLTRKAFVQFDLQAMFDGDVFADFVVLWLTCHRSRFEGDVPEKCLLELWTREAVEQGTRALDQLRVGVEAAIAALGEGFLANRANRELKEALVNGDLDKQDYYRQLLRLVYRLLFLLVTENRDLLLRRDVDQTARARYTDHYGIERLRTVADQVRGGPHPDQWRSLLLVFEALSRPDGQPTLALPGLGGFLWSDRGIGHLAACELDNEHLFRALRALSMVRDGHGRRRIDYVNQGSQELGSVYESLLELHPVLDARARTFELSTAGGNERKTTGSYYTPDELVEELLDSALDPVLDEAETADDPEVALLAVTVLDPACGSGHFLIAAARRIANRLARVRSDDGEPSPEQVATAVRDVVGRCLHGIDVNEMAVELCKVSLWMEAAEPGKPLSFLEHRIVHGNGLLGTTPRLIEEGIPDDAFKALTGDDRAVVTVWKKRNRQERGGQESMLFGPSASEDLATLAAAVSDLDALPDNDVTQVQAKERTWSAMVHGDEMARSQLAANAWCAAFVAPKVPGAPLITTAFVRDAARQQVGDLDSESVRIVNELADEYQFLHPHLAFPEVFQAPADGEEPSNEAAGWSGGFSVVLGNPPWERVKLQEREFFATRRPEIAGAANASKRKRMIEALASGDSVDQELLNEFREAVRHSEGTSLLLRTSNRYPLCGRGDVNTYTVFAEGMRDGLASAGRLGVIVPSGIATDDTTKHFFADLVDRRSLVSLFDFENAAPIFVGVHRSFKFCLLTVAGHDRPVEEAEFVFFARRRSDLVDLERRFTLSNEDFALLNPNTRTCPILRSRRDAELLKAIHRATPILVADQQDAKNEWKCAFSRMILMSDHSSEFFTFTEDEVQGPRWSAPGGEEMVPLLEAKNLHLFDHRWSVGDPPHRVDKKDPAQFAFSRYWITKQFMEERSTAKQDWVFGWRDIARSTDERTLIVACGPAVGYGHKFPLIIVEDDALLLYAALASYIADFCVRQKVGSASVTYFVLWQTPVPSPQRIREFAARLFGDEVAILNRIVELIFTSWDMEGLAIDQGFSGPPYRWIEERRRVLRAELDAFFFLIYGVSRSDMMHVLASFEVLERKEIATHGEFLTRGLIESAFDGMVSALERSEAYASQLDPPPGDQKMRHPESTRPIWAKP